MREQKRARRSYVGDAVLAKTLPSSASPISPMQTSSTCRKAVPMRVSLVHLCVAAQQFCPSALPLSLRRTPRRLLDALDALFSPCLVHLSSCWERAGASVANQSAGPKPSSESVQAHWPCPRRLLGFSESHPLGQDVLLSLF